MAAAVDTKLIHATPRTTDGYRAVTAVVSAAAPAALVVIVLTLLQQALPAIQHYGPAFLIRKDVWLEAGPHRGRISHDYDHWLRVEEACSSRARNARTE